MGIRISSKIQASLGVLDAFASLDSSELDWGQSCLALEQNPESPDHRERGLITALNTLHVASREGSPKDKADILEHRVKILKVNEMLRADESTLRGRLKTVLQATDSEVASLASELKNFQVKLPDSRMRRIFLFATRPLRAFFVFVSELVAALASGVLSVFATVNLDSRHHEKNRRPVLFLHGVNHNQSGWLPGQQMLRIHSAMRKAKLGSFYSISYAGIFFNKRSDNFDLYADRVFDKVRKIHRQTNQMPVLVGHSMGGIVSTCLAKKLADAATSGEYKREDGSIEHLSDEERQALQVSQIITLGSPFAGSFVADGVCGIQQRVGIRGMTVYQDMMTDTKRGELGDRLTDLCEFAKAADKQGNIRYYNIGSTMDEFVPSGYFVTEDPRRQREYTHLGHLSLIMSPAVWSTVYEWLSEIPPDDNK